MQQRSLVASALRFAPYGGCNAVFGQLVAVRLHSNVPGMITSGACVTGAGFSVHARVRSKSDYAHVFTSGRRISHPLLVLHWLLQAEPITQARLGLAVSRKVDRRAVVRNRIKRALREQFRLHRATIVPGMYVVVARTTASDAPNAQLRDALMTLLNRAGALKPASLTGTMPSLAFPDLCAGKHSDSSLP